MEMDLVAQWAMEAAAEATAQFTGGLSNEDAALITALTNDETFDADLDRRERELFHGRNDAEMSDDELHVIYETPDLTHSEKVQALNALRTGQAFI